MTTCQNFRRQSYMPFSNLPLKNMACPLSLWHLLKVKNYLVWLWKKFAKVQQLAFLKEKNKPRRLDGTKSKRASHKIYARLLIVIICTLARLSSSVLALLYSLNVNEIWQAIMKYALNTSQTLTHLTLLLPFITYLFAISSHQLRLCDNTKQYPQTAMILFCLWNIVVGHSH